VRLRDQALSLGRALGKYSSCGVEQCADTLKRTRALPSFLLSSHHPLVQAGHEVIKTFRSSRHLMFKFLRNLFQRSAAVQAPSATVPLEQLEDWLTHARAPACASLVEQLAATRSRVDQLVVLAREKVQALQSAELMNPAIPDRAKDIMRGNREEYCRRVAHYLTAIALPSEAERLPLFFDQHQRDAEEFTRGILRPFQVLQEFFAHESKAITAILAEIEQQLVTLRAAYDQANLDAARALSADIQALLIKHRQLQGLEHECREFEQQQREAMQSIQALDAEEARLLKDPVRHQALQKIAGAQKLVSAHEQTIRDIFRNFEPALRKFHRMATRHVKRIERYLQDPVAALTEDLHLDILEAIADITRLITFDRLSLGDKKEHVLDALQFLTKEQLGTWMRDYGKLTKTEREARDALAGCEASRALERVQRLREETRRAAHLAGQRLAHARNDLEKMDLDALTRQLETRIQELTGTVVTITLPA
jgi:hypothetical protein